MMKQKQKSGNIHVNNEDENNMRAFWPRKRIRDKKIHTKFTLNFDDEKKKITQRKDVEIRVVCYELTSQIEEKKE